MLDESIVEDAALAWFVELGVAAATCKDCLQVRRSGAAVDFIQSVG
jgi:hypothetical protein